MSITTQYTRRINFSQSGHTYINIPKAGYRYMSIINDTAASIMIYRGRSAEPDELSLLIHIRPYWQRTFPLDADMNDVTIFYQLPGGQNAGYLDFIISEENLMLNTDLGGTSQQSINITSDQVGLAKEKQFPATLDNGAMKVSVMNPVSITNFPPVQRVEQDNPLAVGSSVISVTGLANTNNADIYVIQADPNNTDNIEYGNGSVAHWLLPGMMVTWYGDLSYKASSGTQRLAITRYLV